VSRRLAFLGSKPLGLAVLRALREAVPPDAWASVLVFDDRDDGRSAFADFEAYAAAHALPLRVVRTAADVDAALAETPPDVVVVSGWYRIIPVERYRPRTRFFGFHGSLLPAYRGNAPLVWQVLNGEPRAGVSFFELVEGMDEGDLVGQHAFPVGPDDTIADVLAEVERGSGALAAAHAPALLAGTAPLTPQAAEGASYCGLRTPDDGRIDWTWPAGRIHDFVRAQTRPYPGAFTTLDTGERVTVWRTERDPRAYWAVPGSVVERRPDALVVGTGAGVIRLVEAEVETPSGVVTASAHIRSLRARLL
jgi:methionyl-tRNA formyltransferase